mmetsp:Transcript_5195/g.9299  ORF Transcript_5195/g.9299 Transcript_5195/m.9299 type:complete len:202 (+) Transcript_5195:1-606(+)
MLLGVHQVYDVHLQDLIHQILILAKFVVFIRVVNNSKEPQEEYQVGRKAHHGWGGWWLGKTELPGNVITWMQNPFPQTSQKARIVFKDQESLDLPLHLTLLLRYMRKVYILYRTEDFRQRLWGIFGPFLLPGNPALVGWDSLSNRIVDFPLEQRPAMSPKDVLPRGTGRNSPPHVAAQHSIRCSFVEWLVSPYRGIRRGAW